MIEVIRRQRPKSHLRRYAWAVLAFLLLALMLAACQLETPFYLPPGLIA
jgi:hypothetical protein